MRLPLASLIYVRQLQIPDNIVQGVYNTEKIKYRSQFRQKSPFGFTTILQFRPLLRGSGFDLLVRQDLDCIFGEDVAHSGPCSRKCNKVSARPTQSVVSHSHTQETTYCNPTIPSWTLHAVKNASGSTGTVIAEPTRRSCSAVLAFEMVVGFTSAEGREKSQYRAIVLGGGREIHL